MMEGGKAYVELQRGIGREDRETASGVSANSENVAGSANVRAMAGSCAATGQPVVVAGARKVDIGQALISAETRGSQCATDIMNKRPSPDRVRRERTWSSALLALSIAMSMSLSPSPLAR